MIENETSTGDTGDNKERGSYGNLPVQIPSSQDGKRKKEIRNRKKNKTNTKKEKVKKARESNVELNERSKEGSNTEHLFQEGL
jgi:hypothetical protein